MIESFFQTKKKTNHLVLFTPDTIKVRLQNFLSCFVSKKKNHMHLYEIKLILTFVASVIILNSSQKLIIFRCLLLKMRDLCRLKACIANTHDAGHMYVMQSTLLCDLQARVNLKLHACFYYAQQSDCMQCTLLSGSIVPCIAFSVA